MNEQVDILLATYQGGSFLSDQFESILNQTYPHLHIWVRDDGSTDETQSIIQHWIQKYPDRITFLPSSKRLGSKGNFATLMQHSQAPYIMFADQDDCWYLNKVEISLNLIKKMEKQWGTKTPLLIHTDLAVVNHKLALISPSFWNYSGLNPCLVELNYLITQNVLTGCTFLMNRSLLKLVLPIPEAAIMHDWWIGLVASCFGKIAHLNQATLLYRQHHANDVGARSYRLWNYLTRPTLKTNCIDQTIRQAHELLNRYSPQLTSSQHRLLQNYLSLNQCSFFKQKRKILKYKFFKQGFFRNLKHFFTKYS